MIKITLYIPVCLKIKPNSVRIRYFSWQFFLFSVTGFELTSLTHTQQNQLLRFMSSDLDYSATSPVKYNFNSRSRGSKLWRSVTFCYWLRTFTLVLAAPADLLIFIWSVIIFDKFINNFPHSYMGLRVPLSLSDTQFYLSPSTMTFFAIKQLKTI